MFVCVSFLLPHVWLLDGLWGFVDARLQLVDLLLHSFVTLLSLLLRQVLLRILTDLFCQAELLLLS